MRKLFLFIAAFACTVSLLFYTQSEAGFIPFYFGGHVADTTKKDTTKYSEFKSLPLKPTRTINYSTKEGSWMSLDVSPDGQTIVFDLMGDLYTMPVTGGKATALTKGLAYDVHPRYSPDGKRLLFISDRNGADNVWYFDFEGIFHIRKSSALKGHGMITRENDFSMDFLQTRDLSSLVSREHVKKISAKSVRTFDLCLYPENDQKVNL